MKLSKVQENVLELMSKGWVLRVDRLREKAWLLKEETDYSCRMKDIYYSTMGALERQFLIVNSESEKIGGIISWELTDKGKKILMSKDS